MSTVRIASSFAVVLAFAAGLSMAHAQSATGTTPKPATQKPARQKPAAQKPGTPKSEPKPVPETPEFKKIAAEAAAAREANRLDEATGLYVKAVTIKPDWSEGWFHLGTSSNGTSTRAMRSGACCLPTPTTRSRGR
jgi:hypothetical protein